jgi:uncharacterized protein
MSDLIAHVEIPSTNLNRTTEFFMKLFNWDFKPFGKGYLLYNTHQGLTVGLRKVEAVKSGDTTTFHINVKDIDGLLAKATGIGGQAFRDKTIIPAMGYYALIKDPDGNIIGLYQKN